MELGKLIFGCGECPRWFPSERERELHCVLEHPESDAAQASILIMSAKAASK